MTADLSPGIMQARTQWNDIFNIVKDDICKFRFLYAKKNLQKIKVKYFSFFFFSNVKRGREFTIIRLLLQEPLQAVLSFKIKENDTRCKFKYIIINQVTMNKSKETIGFPQERNWGGCCEVFV